MRLRRAAVGRALVVAFLISASANLACSASVHVGSDSPESGSRTVRAKHAGFRMDVPDDWLALNLDDKNPEEALKRFRQATKLTGVGSFFTDDPAKVVAEGVKLYALKPHGRRIGSEVFVDLVPGNSSLPREQDIRGELTAHGIEPQDLEVRKTRVAGEQESRPSGDSRLATCVGIRRRTSWWNPGVGCRFSSTPRTTAGMTRPSRP